MGVIIVALLTAIAAATSAQSSSEFVGSTPCDAAPRRFLAIPPTLKCEKVTWQLTVSGGSGLHSPEGSYTLTAVYGIQIPGAAGFVDGGARAQLRGTWVGSMAGQRAVYTLVADNPRRSLSFVLFEGNLLHPQNDDGTLMVGNGGWSYTLHHTSPVADDATAARLATSRISETPPASSDVAGVFEGRSPCAALARQLKIAANPACTKIKWRLTLHPAGPTRAGRYTLEGYVYRTPPRTGTWTARHRTGNPPGLVYVLDAGKDTALAFFKADDNLLFFLDERDRLRVGDIDYGYTLNRVK